MVHHLWQPWHQLLAEFEVPPSQVQASFADLVRAYTSRDRYYHTLEHIEFVLRTLEPLQTQTQNWSAVQLAGWLHDVVYDPQAQDNEERSADYAQALLSGFSLPSQTIADTVRLILNTKSHQAIATDIDSQVLLDADLAILGAPPHQYQEYAQAIRQEYAWVPEVEYRAGRRRVLEQFLQRDRIYNTPDMVALAEEQARENLTQESLRLGTL